ncbi:hypothetical protein TVAGG3_0186160, partial [Trichomonas vaginalis G3]
WRISRSCIQIFARSGNNSQRCIWSWKEDFEYIRYT